MKARALISLSVLAALLLAGANAHLVYVAVTSQPDCVDHVRLGDADRRDAEKAPFRAAKSSCSPGGRS